MFRQPGEHNVAKNNQSITYFCWWTFPSLCRAGKKSRTLHHCPVCPVFVRACWLWGGGDRWHHNNSSPGHLSPRRLTHNGSSPLRYDPLTPIRPWQRDAPLPPLQGCLSPAGTGGVAADSWVGRCERPPSPMNYSRFLWAHPNLQKPTRCSDSAAHRKSSTSSFRANVNRPASSHHYCCRRWQSVKVSGDFHPAGSECICRRKISWKEKKKRAHGMSEISLGETDGITEQRNTPKPRWCKVSQRLHGE